MSTTTSAPAAEQDTQSLIAEALGKNPTPIPPKRPPATTWDDDFSDLLASSKTRPPIHGSPIHKPAKTGASWDDDLGDVVPKRTIPISQPKVNRSTMILRSKIWVVVHCAALRR